VKEVGSWKSEVGRIILAGKFAFLEPESWDEEEHNDGIYHNAVDEGEQWGGYFRGSF